MENTVQVISLSVFNGGGCLIRHKHNQFLEDVFISNSNEGTARAIYNLLQGFLPLPADLNRKPGKPKPAFKSRPKLRPID